MATRKRNPRMKLVQWWGLHAVGIDIDARLHHIEIHRHLIRTDFADLIQAVEFSNSTIKELQVSNTSLKHQVKPPQIRQQIRERKLIKRNKQFCLQCRSMRNNIIMNVAYKMKAWDSFQRTAIKEYHFLHKWTIVYPAEVMERRKVGLLYPILKEKGNAGLTARLVMDVP